MNSASDDNPTFRQRLSIHRRGEKAQWKDTLHIGRSIMYAMVATRPDLAHVIEVVNRYMSNPRRKHWDAVKHILRYLRGTKDGQLTFRSTNPTEFKGYTDSDYVKNAENRNSTSCYIFTFGGGTTVSTTKAKYIAASDAAKESIWLHRLLADFLVTR